MTRYRIYLAIMLMLAVRPSLGQVGNELPADRTSIDALRQSHQQLEKKTREMANRIETIDGDSRESAKQRADLRAAVQRAFAARQQLQRAELAEFARRVQRIGESLESRERIAAQIIDKRVTELLHPNAKWEVETFRSEPAIKSGNNPNAAPMNSPFLRNQKSLSGSNNPFQRKQNSYAGNANPSQANQNPFQRKDTRASGAVSPFPNDSRAEKRSSQNAPKKRKANRPQFDPTQNKPPTLDRAQNTPPTLNRAPLDPPPPPALNPTSPDARPAFPPPNPAAKPGQRSAPAPPVLDPLQSSTSVLKRRLELLEREFASTQNPDVSDLLDAASAYFQEQLTRSPSKRKSILQQYQERVKKLHQIAKQSHQRGILVEQKVLAFEVALLDIGKRLAEGNENPPNYSADPDETLRSLSF